MRYEFIAKHENIIKYTLLAILVAYIAWFVYYLNTFSITETALGLR